MRIDPWRAEQGNAIGTVMGVAMFELWFGSGFGPAQLSTCGVNP